MSVVRVTVDPTRPDASLIATMARLIRDGGVVAIPTDTLYGLAADPFNPAAVGRVFAIKGRTSERALPLVAAHARQVREWLGDLPEAGRCLADCFWPGPLTLLMPASPRLAPEVAGGRLTVGVRVPAHAVARALSAACGQPITATSANVSGEPATADPEEVLRQIGDRIDALLDAGPTPGGLPSTLVDVTCDPPALVRVGAIPWNEIQQCLRRG